MSSQTDICNIACVLLGDQTIVSINDNTKRAQTLKSMYDVVRKAMLRKNAWKFSLIKTQIASITPALPIPPPFNQAFAMPPGDQCLRLWDIGNTRQTLGYLNYRTGLEKLYLWQGNTIFTQLASPLWIHYSQDITDTTQFDPSFVWAFGARLADVCCETITQSSQKRAQAQAEYKKALWEAETTNAIEQLPDGMADDSWTLGRL